MGKEQSSPQAKDLAFLLSGLIDSIVGGALLLIWFGFLPVDLTTLGLPRWLVGGLGALLFFSGIAVVTYQLTKPRLPE